MKAKPLLNLLGLVTVNNIYCQQVLKFSHSRHKGLLPEVLDNTFQYASIVNLGTGYETLGISKAGTIQSQLDIETTALTKEKVWELYGKDWAISGPYVEMVWEGWVMI